MIQNVRFGLDRDTFHGPDGIVRGCPNARVSEMRIATVRPIRSRIASAQWYHRGIPDLTLHRLRFGDVR